jgi:anti-sigma B factor antagonist
VTIVHLLYILHLTYTRHCRNLKPMINLYINERPSGDVTVLDLKGKLRIGGNSLALHRSIRSLISEKKTMILLNLSGVTYIDSCGLGELVASQVSVENSGGEIKLTGLSDGLRELFTATRLLAVFDTYAAEADAILDFAAPRAKLEKPALAFA